MASAARLMDFAPGGLRRDWRGFFFVTNPRSDDGEVIDDHLALVALHDPGGAARFIRFSTALSTFVALTVGLATAGYLLAAWRRCDSLSRPLQWWLLGQALFQVAQLPIRLALHAFVRAAEEAGESISDCVLSITASAAWSVGRDLAMAHYMWVLLGAWWWWQLEPCATCPDIALVSATVIAVFFLRAIAVTALFCACTTCSERRPEAFSSRTPPATKIQIASLSVMRSPEQSCSEDARNCAICLVRFVGGEEVKRLPCHHDFHPCCIDKWLLRNKKCPLCNRPIDEPLPAR